MAGLTTPMLRHRTALRVAYRAIPELGGGIVEIARGNFHTLVLQNRPSCGDADGEGPGTAAVSDEMCGDGWAYNADAAASFCSGEICDPATITYDKMTCCSWTAWTQAAGRQCARFDYIATHSTQAEAQAACEADAACLSIMDGSCDGEGDWSTCRLPTGASTPLDNCLYVKP